MNDYPIGFEVDYVESRSRVSTFFRWLLVIPHLFVVMFWALALYIVVPIAWIALLITGRWPQGLYAFTARFVRYISQVYGYAFLLTDRFPAFGGAEDGAYPVRLPIAPPQESYNRLKVLLRIFYVIPAAIIQYALIFMAEVIAMLSWFAILFTGRQPAGFQKLIDMGLAYSARALGLFLLLTETYPPISNDAGQLSGGATPAALAPERPAGF